MIIYKTTNTINGKIYIGQDKHNDPNYFGSGVAITRAMKKHGKEHFIKEIIEYCTTQDELNEREKYWIATYNSTDKQIGYNIALGGGGAIFPKEYYMPGSEWYKKNSQLIQSSLWKQKMQQLYDSPEWQHKVTLHNQKKPDNPEWRKKNQAQREKMYQDPEWRRKLIERNKRMAQDPEWRKKNKAAVSKRSQTAEWKKNTTAANQQFNAKMYTGFVAPDGTVHANIFNLQAFARLHNIPADYLYRVYSGKYKQYKGWRRYEPNHPINQFIEDTSQ